jgi:hypothetical protein
VRVPIDLKPGLGSFSMPVVLPVAPAIAEPPAPPRAIIWALLLIATLAASATSTVLLWTAATPTGSPQFWLYAVVFPALSWCLLLGLRLYYYEDEKSRLAAEQAIFREDEKEALVFGRDPLAVLGSAYLCAMEPGNAASAIVQKKSVLKPGITIGSSDPVRFTSLELFEPDESPGRYRALFVSLLDRIQDVALGLRADVPYGIRLQLPEETDRAALLQTFMECWAATKYPAATVSLLDASQGLMALDEWLDIEGGPELEKITLYIAAQLHDQSLNNNGEAGVAIFLGWAPLIHRLNIEPAGFIHRPVAAELQGSNAALCTALQWGSIRASEVTNVWQAALSPEDKSFLLSGSPDAPLAASQMDGYGGIYNVDLAVGNAGAASAWLAAALAIEWTWRSRRPQLVAARENSLRFAVIQPAELKQVTEVN